MIDFSKFFSQLNSISSQTAEILQSKTKTFFKESKHGDLKGWLDILESMPDIQPSSVDLNTGTIRIGDMKDCDDHTSESLQKALMQFHPWRKGPFNIFGINIDTEWRCDMKWDRLKDKVKSLKDKLILDVGSGNGYYCLRMAGQDAKAVVGIDPYLLYTIQYQALNEYIKCDKAAVVPLGLEDIPDDLSVFDTIFYMGVLHHRREPLVHLKKLFSLLAGSGQLILETLVLEADTEQMLVPEGRYAKMRNVWNIPSPKLLVKWLGETGFANMNIIDITKTTFTEQKTTDWMQYESLPDYIDPDNPDKTIEGYPAPIRAVILADKI